MNISLDLPVEKINHLRRATEVPDDASAVEYAVDDFLKRKSELELIEVSGTIEISDAWRFHNQVEVVPEGDES